MSPHLICLSWGLRSLLWPASGSGLDVIWKLIPQLRHIKWGLILKLSLRPFLSPHLESLRIFFHFMSPCRAVIEFPCWTVCSSGVDNNENFISISTSIFSKNFHNNGININTQSSNLQYQFWFQYYRLLSTTSKPISILPTVFCNISMDINISKWIFWYHNDLNNFK